MKTPGFLDGTYKGRGIYDAYMVGGKKNGSGGRFEGSGLFELLSSQSDFVNEVTLLQYFTEHRTQYISKPSLLEPPLSQNQLFYSP
jgi:hypothetical protein